MTVPRQRYRRYQASVIITYTDNTNISMSNKERLLVLFISLGFYQSFKLASPSATVATSGERWGKKFIPVTRSTSLIEFTYLSIVRLPAVFLQINPIPFGFPFRHKTTLKKASGTTTLFWPITSCSLRRYIGPHTMYISLYFTAHSRQAISISFQSPLLRLACCGHIFVMRNDSYITSASHLLSPAGHMCPRVHPLFCLPVERAHLSLHGKHCQDACHLHTHALQ